MNNQDYTIKSMDHLQGVVDGIAYALLNINNIIIEKEKNFSFDVFENPKGGFCLKTSFTDYYIEAIFKGDHNQPADDPEPHTQEQIFYISVGSKVSNVVRDFIEELERISDADCPDETVTREEMKQDFKLSLTED